MQETTNLYSTFSKSNKARKVNKIYAKWKTHVAFHDRGTFSQDTNSQHNFIIRVQGAKWFTLFRPTLSAQLL